MVSINTSLLKEKYPFFAIATIFSIIAFLAQKKGEAVISLGEIPFSSRLANAFVAYLSYLGKTLIPLDLSVFYPFPSHISLWKSLGACIIIVIVTVVLFRLRQRQPWLITGWLWYLVTLLPVIGIVQVGMQGMADRYTYIPLIGIFISGVWGVAEISGSMAHRRLFLIGSTSAIILICCFVSVRQVSYWKNTSTLFTHALVSNPDNYMAHTVLGRESRREGNPDKAIHHFNEAIRIAPWYQISYINMGDILISLQNYDQAIIFLEKVLELNRQLYEDPYEAHYLLGLALSETGRITEAVSHFEASMRLNRNPGTSAAYCNQAFMLSKLGRLDEAIFYYGKALDINPANVECRNNLGIAFAQKGQPDEAVRHFEEVLRIKPDFDVVRSNMKQAQIQMMEKKSTK